MNELGNVIYLNKEQFTELANNGTLTVDGSTINFTDTDIYLAPDDTDERLEALETAVKMYRHIVTTTYPYDGGTATLTFEAINHNPKVFSLENRFPLIPTGSSALRVAPLMYNGEYMCIAEGEGNDRVTRFWLAGNFTATVEEYKP